MFRVANPTDNPIIEAVNGWVRGEQYVEWNFQNNLILKTVSMHTSGALIMSDLRMP
jgi:hypothetical protein